MKILHVIGAFDKKLGGTYSAILSIIRIEKALGFDNEVLSLVSNGQEYDSELDELVHLFPPSFPYMFSNSLRADNWMTKNISRFSLVIIHEVWGATAIKAAHKAHRNNIPYVIWPHGSLDPFDLQKKRLLKKHLASKFVKSVICNAAAICCTSKLEGNLLQTYNEPNGNIYTLPLPINYEGKGNRQAFRERHKIGKKDFVLLFLSRVDYKKGLDLLLKAVQMFIDRSWTYNTRILIAGKGSESYETYIKFLVKDFQIEKYVIFGGFLSGQDKADAYAGADCFVLPSMNENYGIAVIESLQSGLPVLISDNVYIWEDIVPDGGWVCKHQIESIYAQIIEIHKAFLSREIEDKDPVAVGNKFNQESLMPLYAAFYDRMLHKRSQPVINQELFI
ncbi:glycosyltransferase [Mucilaginibacter achroorhodeus]|uniref:Glycosyltransferase n=1 Tax=Mucilaginibacter achroorhodeus TaxID=2599294 RepID=A0A563U6N6_9SPHI|nr:glycosyltransferase [Mucilaginibacter achroorhodeus]TWR27012.1 glycosyltransferase [Mucilaginibacter achroorhodeus]